VVPEVTFQRDLWRLDAHLAPVAALLPQIQLLSLDVFDTLLLRTCRRPEDVFTEVGCRATARGLLARGIGPEEFASLRQGTQHHLYATLGSEPSLEDIYAALPRTLGSPTRLLRLEEEVETEMCVLNPSVASLVAHCAERGIRVVLLSDMYLGERRVRALLAQAGFDPSQWTDSVFVSVDAGGYKMTGAMYDLLAAAYPDIPRSAMLHIGDNVRSDVRAARAAGLHAVHYDMVRHDPDGVLALEALVCGSVVPELDALRRLAASMTGGLSDEAHGWHRVGATVVGPFTTALVEWALDQCEAEGVDLIAPLMREGHMLGPMLRRAAEARGLFIEVAPLYVSRQAVAFAGASDTRDDFVARLLDYRRHMTVGEIFDLVTLATPSELAGHANLQITSASAVNVAPGRSVRTAMVEFLQTEAAERQISSLVQDERTRLVAYLDQVRGGHHKMATLDVGFFGQIQRSIDRALANEGRGVHTMHLLAFGHGPVLNDVASGMDVRTFAGSYGTAGTLVKTIHRSAPVLEQLLQGPEGSTVGYAHGADGQVAAIREVNPLTASEIECKAIAQSAILRFQDLWLALRSARPSTTAGLVARKDAWRQIVHRLIDVPSNAEAHWLGSLHDDVNFGSRAVLPFCPADVEAQIAWTGAEGVLRRGTSAVPAVWPQGLIARIDPGVVVSPHAAVSETPYGAAALTLARALRARGVSQVIGYGTGEVADAFIDAARIMGVGVAALVDSDLRQHGLRRRGVDIISLDDGVALGVHTYVVLSVAHARPITDTIRARYHAEPVSAHILDLTQTP
jgi:predicted HAD superfamily hydrolase